nr:MAG TPA: hypothetical protein [Caudoviricetes sp.]
MIVAPILYSFAIPRILITISSFSMPCGFVVLPATFKPPIENVFW